LRKELYCHFFICKTIGYNICFKGKLLALREVTNLTGLPHHGGTIVTFRVFLN
jgi:hypothetical protein